MQQISQPPLGGSRYRLGPLIANGGMSAVHKAWDVVLQRPVAVKRYVWNRDATAQRRFREEARTLAQLSHPGLVAVYDARIDPDTEQPYLVLQLIEGTTLRERIAEGPMHPDDVHALGARLAHALAYAHSRGVIHRDVKPSNVLLDGDGAPYLADFGISRMVDGARVTRPGEFLGTAGYLAPEQVRGEDVGPPVDVYALGLVLLECLTGRAEYTGNDVEVAVARLSRPPHIPDGTPADLAFLIAAMTAFAPRERPTAAQCAADLNGWPPRPEVAAGPDPSEVLAARSRRRWRERSVLVMAVLIIILSTSIGLALLGFAQPDAPGPAIPGPAQPPALVGAVPVRVPAGPVTAGPVTAEPAEAVPPVAAVRDKPARHDGRGGGRGGDRGSGKPGKPGRG